MSIFDELPDRASTESIKWHAYDPDVLPMWVADMDFVSPEPVIRALHDRVAHGVFGYPGEVEGLRAAVTDWLASRHGWKIDPQWLVFVPGVVTGVNLAAQALVGKGEAVLIQPPVYMPFLGVHANANAFRHEAQLTLSEDGRYTIDFDAFEDQLNWQTKLFILCSPHNPVGRVFTRAELERMAEICLKNNVLICSDEIHADLVFSGHHHIPIASLDPEIAARTVTFIAPSKTFNLAGLGCSVGIIPDPELRRRFAHADRGLVHGVNLLGLVAAKAAFREGGPWLDELMVYLEANRDLLVKYVAEEMPGVRMSAPEGTYLAWLDCRGAGIGGDPSKFFTEKARVAVNEGVAFGAGGEGFVRFNFGCPRSMLLEALGRMSAALKAAARSNDQ